MKKFILLLSVACSFLSASNALAQRADTIPASGSVIIKNGIQLNDDGKYEEAIQTFNRVSNCDPSYSWACYETALSLTNLQKYDAALQKCIEAGKLNPMDPNTAILKGSILDDLGRRTEAINWLTEISKKWPYNYNLIFNLAICYINTNNPEKAEELLIKGLHYNPYHASSHMALAKVNYIMGRKAQSYLAYNMGILLNPSIRNINFFEKSITGENDSISQSYKFPYPKNFNHGKWDELTGLLNAELSFKDDFPYDFKLNYITTRQSLMLFRKMVFDEKDPSFYNQLYVRFFSGVLNNDDFETLTYYLMQNTDNKIVSDWIAKNKIRYDKFVDRAKDMLNTWRSYGFSADNETRQEKSHHFSNDGDLEGIGVLRKQSEPSKEGHWIIINDEGGLSEEGTYKNNKTEGEWLVYWNNGSVKQRLNFKAGQLDGQNITYHPNGIKSGIYPRLSGKREGIEEEYTSSGKLYIRHPYVNDKSEGPFLEFDFANGFRSESNFRNGKKEGVSTEKWLNGNNKTEATYKDSLLNGSFKKWYANGKPESTSNYKNDNLSGKRVVYHANGIKSTEAEYDETGNLTGSYSEYDRTGKLKMMSNGYKNGQLTGTLIYYYANGKPQSTLNYKDDRITHMECFDLEGKKIYTADENGDTIRFRSFYPGGQIQKEGLYKNGKREGSWIRFNPVGKVMEEENWSNGMQSGSQKNYYENGNLKMIFSCDSNRIVGPFNRFFMNGHPDVSGYYDKDGYTGEWTSYYSNDSVRSRSYCTENKLVGRRMSYSPTGKLTLEERFNNNGDLIKEIHFDINGKISDDLDFEFDSLNYTQRYPNGKLKAKISICDRKPNGIQEYYYSNGQLRSRQNFIYGNAQGTWKVWDHHGKLMQENNYVMNELDGLSKSFVNGKITHRDFYENGKDQGEYLEYHPNGRVLRSINFIDDEKQGISNYYSPDSTWMFGLHFADNSLQSISYIDNQNRLISQKPVELSTQEIVCFYPNGKISARIPLKKGIYDGKNITYFPNGNIMRERIFVNDYLEGTDMHYYENGKLQECIEFRNGERNGNYISYFENGLKEMEGKYTADKKMGKWSVYDKVGKLIETLYYENDELYDIQ